ncbi:MAG: flagellar assembly protein FliW [Clostridiales bacterium GWC2_40_7]|nr:MAG: flagellar assembly protein FliW [Clostridiales bacterium GWC2_40_7]
MLLETKHFGEIEYMEENILNFDSGLPGFENVKKYIFIDSPDEQSIFKWLQSVDNPQLAFAIVNPFLVKEDYDFEISDEDMRELGIESAEDVVVYSILVVPDDLTKVSMNLKAPVIINVRNKKGAQIVLDTDNYTVRHYILDELRRQEVAGNACSDEKERSNHCNK